MTRALIFDCDGVLADTERDGHRIAFNETFAHFGVPVRWSDDEYGELLRIGGGKERMTTLFAPDRVEALGLPDDPAAQQELVARWHAYKTDRYTQLVQSGALPARPGVRRLAAQAHDAGWHLAVASTSAEASVRAVLEHAVGAELATQFTVCAGDVVAHKKPAPDIYLLTLERLGVDAGTAIAVEDSAIGLRAALAAGLRTIVTVSGYTASEDFHGAAAVVDSLGDLPDTVTTVIADASGLGITGEITIADLARVSEQPRA